jgi:hypothetical protein
MGLPRLNRTLTQLRFIHNWDITLNPVDGALDDVLLPDWTLTQQLYDITCWAHGWESHNVLSSWMEPRFLCALEKDNKGDRCHLNVPYYGMVMSHNTAWGGPLQGKVPHGSHTARLFPVTSLILPSYVIQSLLVLYPEENDKFWHRSMWTFWLPSLHS